MSNTIEIRALHPADSLLPECAELALLVHRRLCAQQGMTATHLDLRFFAGGMSAKLARGGGFCAVKQGVVVGSAFFSSFPQSTVATIGPVTAASTSGERIGSRLLRRALAELEIRGMSEVRLNQHPATGRSLATYLRAGFRLHEPLSVLRFPADFPQDVTALGPLHRELTLSDIAAAEALSVRCFGVSRAHELRAAVNAGTARFTRRTGELVGYATGCGLNHHAVAAETETLGNLLTTAAFPGALCFAPTHNDELLRRLLDQGCRIEWSANLMSTASTTYALPHVPSLSA